jgi:glycosyltransferase involved in cell wall biosynthesis
MHEPLVSVVMPVYNVERFVAKAINSILLQTLTNWELIIINDASSDKSEEIIRSFTDTRIQYLQQPTNSGVVAAMNKGVEQAKGKYITVMHADDIAVEDRIQKQYEYMEQHLQTAVLAGKTIFINEDDKPVERNWKTDEQTNTYEEIKARMVWENCIAHPTVMMRKDVVTQYGYSSSPLHQGFAVEDYPLWLHILSDGYIIEKLQQPVLYYRQHESSATTAFLRKRNPFLVNYHSKRFYLQQRKEQGKSNAFDKKVRFTMYLDYLKAMGKDIKKLILRK